MIDKRCIKRKLVYGALAMGAVFTLTAVHQAHAHAAETGWGQTTNVSQPSTASNNTDNVNSNDTEQSQTNNNQASQVPQRHLLGAIPTYNQQPKPVAYDISQWQGYVSPYQADQLRNETKFMILRAQAGDYKDSQIDHNIYDMNQAHEPYGVYSYSYYTSPYNARLEAKELYQRAPHANFYANDCEENDSGASLDEATHEWADEMHSLTNKPVILYSDLYFLNTQFSPATRNAYDRIWVAAYGPQPNPAYHYDLWQYSSSHYSPALGQDVDADTLPYNAAPVSVWTRKKHSHSYIVRVPKRYFSKRFSYHKTMSRVRTIVHTLHSNRARIHYLTYAVQHLYTLNSKDRSYVWRLWDRFCQNRSLSFKLTDASNQYYCSPKIHHLIVKAPHGTEAYSYYNGSWVANIPYGTHVHVWFFRYVINKGTQITRAVGRYHGHEVIFSSNKKYVKW